MNTAISQLRYDTPGNELSRNTNIQYTRILPMNSVDRVEKTGGSKPMEKPVKMLLSLLRGALSDEPVEMESFKGSNYSDWVKMLDIANEASVTGMALDASKKLPKGTLPKVVEMKMSHVAKESESRHAQQEAIIGELSEMLAKKGIETVQLKGVGFSMNYPEPTHRFGGDIDIFTRLKGKTTKGISDSYLIVDNMMEQAGIEVENHNKSKNTKHSEFDYKGIRIENHHYFINKERMTEAPILDEFLHKSLNPREQVLPHGTKILVPSKEFNSVFMAHHAFQHYIFGGIDLHHLTDWGMHIKENGLQMPEEAKGTKFEKFTYALTNLSNRYLGTNVKVPEDRKYEDEIFNTLLHPEMDHVPEGLNKPQIVAFKTKRLIKRTMRTKEYTGESVVKTLWRAVLNKVKDPAALFRRF